MRARGEEGVCADSLLNVKCAAEQSAARRLRRATGDAVHAHKRPIVVLLIATYYVVLIAASYPRQTGDSPEYLATARSLVELRLPIWTSAELDAVNAGLRTFPNYRGASVCCTVTHRDGERVVAPHFWFYSLLAAPGVALSEAAGRHPNYGFALVNVLLLIGAARIATSRLPLSAVVLVFAGPAIWWLDKPHTEPLTFAALVVAATLAVDRPWWSMLALAVASTQNPPLALLIPFVAAAAVVGRRSLLKDRRLWLGFGSAGAVASIAPIYFVITVGAYTPQVYIPNAIKAGLPTVHEMGAFLFDLNIGLIPAFPLLVPIAAWAVLTARSMPSRAELTFAGVSLVALLLVFGMAGQANSGGTPSMSRYALWLIPLAIPFLALARGAWLGAAVALSVGVTLGGFFPGLESSFLRPTPLAAYLWEEHPGVYNPIAEVFYERVSGLDRSVVLPIATANCAKVLVIEGAWPAQCPEHEAPGFCSEPGSMCYANRSSDGYRFVPAGGE
jgi:hypothetical protein